MSLQFSGLFRAYKGLGDYKLITESVCYKLRVCVESDNIQCFLNLINIRNKNFGYFGLWTSFHGHTIINSWSLPFKHCTVWLYNCLSQVVTHLQVMTHRWLPPRCPRNRSRRGPPRWPRSGTRPRRPWWPDGSVGCCLPAPGACLHSTGEEEDRQRARQREEERAVKRKRQKNNGVR